MSALRPPFPLLLLLTSLATPLTAQQTRVVPPGYDVLEGNSLYSYPFRIDGAIQVIYGSDQFGTSGTALLRGMSYRANAPFAAFTGFSKRMKVTLYGTLTAPAVMTKDPTANIGGATGTVAFDTTLNLPTVPAVTRAPGPFQLAIPFTSIYTLDTQKHHLLTHVEPGDATTLPTSSWNLDAVNHYATQAFARRAVVGEGCTNASGYGLSISVSSASYAGGTLGVSLRRTSTTPIGSFPTAFHGIDFAVQRTGYPFDLAPAGMSGCLLQIDPQLVFAEPESTSGTYNDLSIAIPNDPKLLGLPYLTQALGATATGPGSVLTDCYQIVNSPGSGVPPASQGIFYVARTATWSASGVGAYYPVTRFDGVFP